MTTVRPDRHPDRPGRGRARPGRPHPADGRQPAARRIGVDDNGSQTWTVYDGQNPYADFNASGTLQERYVHGPGVVNGAVADVLLARTNSGGTTAWYLPDKLGTVRDIANTSGTVIDHIAYDSYGNVTGETSPANGDRFKYAGQEYDPTIGLYYDRARYYDPATGRFLTQDPSGFAAGDVNLYRYVGDEPTNATDPTGLMMDPGSPGYDAAMQAYSQQQLALSQQQHQMSGGGAAPTATDQLDEIDQFFAGWASSLTGGATDAIRSGLYGEIATRNQSGGLYEGGQTVGSLHSLALSMANPCAMAPGYAASLRALAAMEAAGNASGGFASFQNGQYAQGALQLASALMGAYQLSQACFAAGTPILTPDGSVPIEDLRVGDWVIAKPEDDPEAVPAPRRVVELIRNYVPLLHLEVGGRTIRTSAEHPFWVRGRGWTQAHQLMAGDHLMSHDGQWLVLEGIEGNQEPAQVYNVQVEEYHTYFVGGVGWGFSVWAHNARCRHHTTSEGLSGIQNEGQIKPSRGQPIGVDVEVEPFGPVRWSPEYATPSAELGASGGRYGGYVEFDLPDNAISTYVSQTRSTARIPTDGPLSLEGLNPVFVSRPWWRIF